MSHALYCNQHETLRSAKQFGNTINFAIKSDCFSLTLNHRQAAWISFLIPAAARVEDKKKVWFDWIMKPFTFLLSERSC